jgi:hypothetical protein
VDYDVYDVYLRRARKPHQCDECRLTIQPGDHYHAHSGLYDGTWHNWKICDSCHEWASLIPYDDEYSDYIIGDLQNALDEKFGHRSWPLIPGQQTTYYAPAYKNPKGEI